MHASGIEAKTDDQLLDSHEAGQLTGVDDVEDWRAGRGSARNGDGRILVNSLAAARRGASTACQVAALSGSQAGSQSGGQRS